MPCLKNVISLSQEKELYNDRYWWVLLHYKKGLLGTESLVDDQDFFFSEQGKHNPQAELEATLKAFFDPDPVKAEKDVCKFIARYTWLKDNLETKSCPFPVFECKKFNSFIKKVNPTSMTLSFPASHMNSPASMFGHTLLVVNTAYKSKLMSYAINYSAAGIDNNGFLFAFKGVFGFYEGYFSILPYYEKLAEYSSMDQRDIWEYTLNLNQEEIHRILMALWEMEHIHSFYYFFDENCSYTLLFLFEIARPSLNLTDQFNKWVLPIDTIRGIIDNGLVEEVHYRPSKASKIRYMVSLSDNKNQDLALKVLDSEITPEEINNLDLELTDKIKILDLVSETLQYRYSKKDIEKDEYTARFLTTLKSRSTLGKVDDTQYKVPQPAPPEAGHDSARLNMGVGLREGDLFQEISLRAAYHELIDNDTGYLKGSQIEFCDVTGRYYPEENDFYLEAFDAISIISLSARDKFFKPVSWKARVGASKGKLIKEGTADWCEELELGGGFAYENNLIGLYYCLIETDMNFGSSFRNDHLIGWGGSLGTLKNITPNWKIHLWGRGIYYPLGDKYASYQAVLSQQFTLDRNCAVMIDLAGKKVDDLYQREMKLSFNFFF